jgi:hypothetical protein
MPRNVSALADEFAEAANSAIAFADGIEEARGILVNHHPTSEALSLFRVELGYEFAYLRMFLAWESFLEKTFYRYLCGFSGSQGQQIMISNKYFRTLAAAEIAVHSVGGKKKNYVLWHNPSAIIKRAALFLNHSHYETTLASFEANLSHYAAVRHRIAHSQAHAKHQFDTSTIALCGRRFRGARPGRFLRDHATRISQPTRWLHRVAADLKGISLQLV